MNEIILLKYGEIALKGLNKNVFEDILLKNIRWRMRDLGNLRIRKAQSTVYLEPADPETFDFDEAAAALRAAGFTQVDVLTVNGFEAQEL